MLKFSFLVNCNYIILIYDRNYLYYKRNRKKREVEKYLPNGADEFIKASSFICFVNISIFVNKFLNKVDVCVVFFKYLLL